MNSDLSPFETASMPETAILLIAHGSRHAPANQDLFVTARNLAGQGEYRIVEAAFLELAEPDIAQGGDRCIEQGANRVLMVPYFLSSGVHLIRDLTAARDELKNRHPAVEFLLGPPLGPDPLLERLVAERARQLDNGERAPRFAPSGDMAERYAPL
jgi:sirohydrochlorin ferrochelatase